MTNGIKKVSNLDVAERFWTVPLAELKTGFHYDVKSSRYRCLICGEAFEEGRIYPQGDALYEAKRMVLLHVERTHGSMLSYLLSLDKKATGLTDLQKELIEYFAAGVPDAEIVKRTGGGSASTIRNHRFALKEKAKQAKLLLAVIELLEEAADGQVSRTAAPMQSDGGDAAERQADRREENGAVIADYFPEGPEGPLRSFPRKEKRRLAILRHIASFFEHGRRYSEKEINEALKRFYEKDYVTLRRYLIEYGFLDREPDGSAYWMKEKEETTMDRRKELVASYQETERVLGVYVITNVKEGKKYVASSPNAASAWKRERFELDMGSHRNAALQADWKRLGSEAFTFEVIDRLELKEKVKHDYKDVLGSEGDAGRSLVWDYRKRLKKLEEMWIEELGSAEPDGYNAARSRSKTSS